VRRFKKTSTGYVFDRLLFLLGLAPLFFLLLVSFLHSMESEYSFYLDCRGSGVGLGVCENPFWPDCPRVVSREAPWLCDRMTLPAGVMVARLFGLGIGCSRLS